MPSQFEETLRRGREKGEAKLKIIAPKFTPPPGPSFGRPTPTRRGGGGGGSSARREREKAAAAKAAAAKAAAAKAAAAKAAAKEKAARATAEKVAKAAAEKKIAKAKTFAEKTRIAKELILSRQQRQAETKRERETRQFQEDLKSGRVLGFSGSGLTPSEIAKRKFLINIGALKEQSTKNIFQKVDPLVKQFFIDTRPTKQEQEKFIDFLRKQQFSTEKVMGPKLNKLQRLADNMRTKISEIRKTKDLTSRNKLEKQITSDKNKIITELKRRALIPANATKRQASLFALGFSESLFSFAGSLPELPAATVQLGKRSVPFVAGIIKDPRTVIPISKKLGRSLAEKGVAFGKLAMVEPGLALGKIGAEIVVLKGAGKTFKVVGKVGGKAANKLDPFLKRVKDNKLSIKTSRGKTILEVGVIGKGVPLKKQVGLAGKKQEAIVSAQADSLLNVIRSRKKIIRKPIPGEETFTQSTKRLLSKFDSGKISKKEIIILNDKVLRESGKTLLERSLFADPKGKIRFTRLGAEQPDARLLDILKGDFTLKSTKPQIIVFTGASIQKFPKNLRDVVKTLKSGKKITPEQRSRLVQFQLKKSGKFKPVGDVEFKGGKELEVTVAPGELIKRKKKLGTTVIDGKRVEIIEAEIFKPKGELKKLISKANKGELTKKQGKILEKTLEKKTGIKTSSIRRRPVARRPRARIPKRIPKRAPRKAPKRPPRKAPKRPPRKAPKRALKRAPKRPPKRAPRKAPKRAPRKAPKRPPRKAPRVIRPPARRAPKGVPPATLPLPSRKRRPKKRRKPKQSYNVFARPLKKRGQKKIPKLIKVNKVPLKKSRAKDVRNFVADTSLARTAAIKRTRGKPGKSKLKVPVGYASRTRPKFRTHRVVKGKRKPLPKGKVIERRTRLLDTKGERDKITLKKRIAQISKPVKKRARRTQARKPLTRTPTRRTTRRPKPTGAKRQQMLKNLAKGRRVLAAKRNNPIRRSPPRKPTPRKPIKRRMPKRRR